MEVLSTPAGGPPVGQRYFVQVGSFADLVNARRVVQRLTRYYRDVIVVAGESGDNRYYRVRMGAFMERSAAFQRALLVSGLGYKPVIISQ